MRFTYEFVLLDCRFHCTGRHAAGGNLVAPLPSCLWENGLAYSTELTRKNPDAWAAAHRHCGKLWVRIGIISAAASGILIALFSDHHSAFWMWLIVGQMVLFCVSVFMVDLLLKTQFGNEK